MFEGKVEVDLAFGVGLAVGLVFAIELIDLALPADLEFEFSFKFIRELGQLSPPLGGGGNDVSLLRFIPNLDPFTGVGELSTPTNPLLQHHDPTTQNC